MQEMLGGLSTRTGEERVVLQLCRPLKNYKLLGSEKGGRINQHFQFSFETRPTFSVDRVILVKQF